MAELSDPVSPEQCRSGGLVMCKAERVRRKSVDVENVRSYLRGCGARCELGVESG